MCVIDHIKTRKELANILNISEKKLTYILYVKKIDNMYRTFSIPKKNGETREINAPEKMLNFVQKNLAKFLLNYRNGIYKTENINNKVSHGFEKEKSFITNAELHKNKRYVLNFDLKDFFDCFHFGRVKGYFEKNRYFKLSKDIATILAQLTCYKKCLPQGAPTSPIIVNLIFNMVDIQIIKLAKTYKLNYTRYADDITFSTNDKFFLEKYSEFENKFLYIIEKYGFVVNKNKTRLQYKDYRQKVTGLVVNKKINVTREYYKETRAMAHQLYKTGSFFIEENKSGTINQLEGRFSFINQIEKYNNIIDIKKGGKKHRIVTLSNKEKEYSKFLFYKNFFNMGKPIIFTEGKTDVMYIKAALKNLYKKYPNLIEETKTGFDYKIIFFRKSKKIRYLLNIEANGADTMKNIANLYSGSESFPNYIEYLKSISKQKPNNPIILLFDNEIESKNKPIKNFLSCKAVKSFYKDDILEKQLKEKNYACLKDNLYVQVTPLIGNIKEGDIETLFKKETLAHKINGKSFIKKDKYNNEYYYGKEIFSKYVYDNYRNIDFSNFVYLLDNINDIIKDYQIRKAGNDMHPKYWTY
ncbi:RNA-directed DNA polymerase [Megamonas funiformis]|nr:RNA-directed DNA polymerase [Megamonas funiformis]